MASYNFDSTVSDGRYDDGSGRGHVLQATPGSITVVPHGSGQALRFPGPRVVLQTLDAPDLNPGAAAFKFGAGVLAPAGRATVIQKGSRYQLGIDSRGRAVCGLDDHQVRSAIPVTDGTWHSLECRRAGATLSIVVDDRTPVSVPVPAGLTLSTGDPFTVGSRYAGSLDDVWLSVG